MLVFTQGELLNIHVSTGGPLIYRVKDTCVITSSFARVLVSILCLRPSPYYICHPVFLNCCLSDDSGAERTKPIYFSLWYLVMSLSSVTEFSWFLSTFSLVDEDNNFKLFAVCLKKTEYQWPVPQSNYETVTRSIYALSTLQCYMSSGTERFIWMKL